MGLKVVAGTQSNFPIFDVYINPLNSKSIGNYYCLVDAIPNNTHPRLGTSNRFNAQEAISSLEAIAIFTTDSKELKVNSPFNGLCSVGNFIEDDVLTTYSVRYYFVPDNSNDNVLIGTYLFVKMEGTFKSRFILGENRDVKIIESLSYFPSFSVDMYLTSSLSGKFKCSVQIDNKVEFFSNEKLTNNSTLLFPSALILVVCLFFKIF